MRSKLDGKAFAAYREMRDPGKSQTEVADRMGISQQSLSKYESGRGVPSWDQIEKLCAYWGIDVPEFRERFIVRVEDGGERAEVA